MSAATATASGVPPPVAAEFERWLEEFGAEYERALERFVRRKRYEEYEWDEEEHPRHPSGSDKGGEFAPKDDGEEVEVRGSRLEDELTKRLGGPKDPSKAADLYSEHKTGSEAEKNFISTYGGKSYSLIANKRLREGKMPKEVEEWDKAFSPLKKDTVTFRGMHDDDPAMVARLAKAGTVISNAGYTSTAFHVENASWFVANSEAGASVMMKITAPKGTRAAVGAESERELVFARGSKLKVTKVHAEQLVVIAETKGRGKSRVVLIEAEVQQ